MIIHFVKVAPHTLYHVVYLAVFLSLSFRFFFQTYYEICFFIFVILKVLLKKILLPPTSVSHAICHRETVIAVTSITFETP